MSSSDPKSRKRKGGIEGDTEVVLEEGGLAEISPSSSKLPKRHKKQEPQQSPLQDQNVVQLLQEQLKQQQEQLEERFKEQLKKQQEHLEEKFKEQLKQQQEQLNQQLMQNIQVHPSYARSPQDLLGDFLNDKSYWTNDSPDAVRMFGGNPLGVPRIGRSEELVQLWKQLSRVANDRPSNKRAALFIHASPGMGKTFILQELTRKDKSVLPDGLHDFVDSVYFLAVDFNRDCCKKAADVLQGRYFDNELFPLARMYYTEFADQTKLSWTTFFQVVANACSGNIVANDRIIRMVKNAITDRIEKSGKTRVVILVDEILKAEAIHHNAPDRYRSVICDWADLGGFCHAVLFSTLETQLMLMESNQSTGSGRPIVAAAKLPLLDTGEMLETVKGLLPTSFYDSSDAKVENVDPIHGLIVSSTSGHPRALQFVINFLRDEARLNSRVDLSSIFAEVAKSLSIQYHRPEFWLDVTKSVLLAESVSKTTVVHTSNGQKITYEDLANCGVLVNSLDESMRSFVPIAPEVYLHYWVQDQKGTVPRLLRAFLRYRVAFDYKSMENMHCTWERLMSRIRPVSINSNIPLHKLYKLSVNSKKSACVNRNKSDIVRCHVNGSAPLERVDFAKLEKGMTLELKPNTIYIPRDRQNAGFDALVVREVSSGWKPTSASEKYLLPTFIQIKWSSENATTTLSISDVTTANGHCRDFLAKCAAGEGYRFLPCPSSESGGTLASTDPFVLLFIAWRKYNGNITDDSPGNVLLCMKEQLKTLYGPTLAAYFDALDPLFDVALENDEDEEVEEVEEEEEEEEEEAADV